MSLDNLKTQVATIERNQAGADEADEHGQPVQRFRPIGTAWCRLWRRTAKEQIKDADVVVGEWAAVLDFGVDVLATDRIVVDGVTYEVKDVNPNPGLKGHHCEASLKAVT